MSFAVQWYLLGCSLNTPCSRYRQTRSLKGHFLRCKIFCKSMSRYPDKTRWLMSETKFYSLWPNFTACEIFWNLSKQFEQSEEPHWISMEHLARIENEIKWTNCLDLRGWCELENRDSLHSYFYNINYFMFMLLFDNYRSNIIIFPCWKLSAQEHERHIDW